MQHSPRSTPSRVLLHTLILMPMLAFYGVFLLRYGQTYLQRRDENIMLALLAELQGGRDIHDLFTMVITPSFLAFIAQIAHFTNVLLIGRLLSMVSALSCALLSARIARSMFPRAVIVPSLTLALVCSSALFVQEGTIFRLDIASLACSLGGIALLLSIQLTHPSNVAWRVWMAGVLFGLALQIKPLMLVIVPCVLYLLWKIAVPSRGGPERVRHGLIIALWHGFGWLVPAAAMIALFGWNGVIVGDQLGKHFEAANQLDFVTRISHSIAVSLEFAQNHFWIALFFALSAYRAWHTRENAAVACSAYTTVFIWAGTTFAILFVNFPSWDHHFVYLLPPLAIGAALLLADVVAYLFGGSTQTRTGLLVICMSIAAVGTFIVANALEQQQLLPDITVVAEQIAARTDPVDEVWTDNQVVLLLSKRRGNPQLIDLSVKRIIAGELPEQELFDLFEKNPPAAVVNYDGLFNAFPRFNACLARVADVMPISLNNQQVFWVRRADIASFVACDKAGH